MARKKRSENLGGMGDWIVTYGDMVTLLLCFFVAMFDITDADIQQMDVLLSPLSAMGMGANEGAPTLSQGKFSELGNTVSALPSMERGNYLGTSLKKAVSLFNPEIQSNKIRVTHDERGLVISLAGDAFFRPASAAINIEETRDMLIRLSELLLSSEIAGRKVRIEGHTDSAPVDPEGRYASNWDLSAARSINVLNYLADFGVDEKRFQVGGFADTVPLAANDTPEGRSYNRRVDIVILDEGHL
jgi:chemotaxis protein MotB